MEEKQCLVLPPKENLSQQDAICMYTLNVFYMVVFSLYIIYIVFLDTLTLWHDIHFFSFFLNILLFFRFYFHKKLIRICRDFPDTF